MVVPAFQVFFRPVLGLALEEPIKLTDCIGEMKGILGLTEEDLIERTRGGTKTRVRDRVEWAGTYLYQAALIERPQRGFILATERGRKVYSENPNGITSDVLSQFPEFRAFQERRDQTTGTGRTDTEEIESATPVERIESAAAELNADLRYELLDQILRASPEFFEDLIIDLMLKMGYGGTDSGTRLGKNRRWWSRRHHKAGQARSGIHLPAGQALRTRSCHRCGVTAIVFRCPRREEGHKRRLCYDQLFLIACRRACKEQYPEYRAHRRRTVDAIDGRVRCRCARRSGFSPKASGRRLLHRVTLCCTASKVRRSLTSTREGERNSCRPSRA